MNREEALAEAYKAYRSTFPMPNFWREQPVWINQSNLFGFLDTLIEKTVNAALDQAEQQHQEDLKRAWYEGEDSGYWSALNEDALAEGVVLARYNPYDPIFSLDNGDCEG